MPQSIVPSSETRAQGIVAVRDILLSENDLERINVECEAFAAQEAEVVSGRIYKFPDGSTLDATTWQKTGDMPKPTSPRPEDYLFDPPIQTT